MFSNMRPFFITLTLFTLMIFSLPDIHAFWMTVPDPESELVYGEGVVIGRWYFQDPDDPNAPDVVIFDPSNPPTETITEGSIVVCLNEDGTTTIYSSLVDIDPNDPDFDPNNPNEEWYEPMRYAEDTSEYRSFHHYQINDYAWHEGKLYQRRVGPHNPNTPSQNEPGTNSMYWKEVDHTTLPNNIWYRHVIYILDDQVSYGGNTYVCILGGRSGYTPRLLSGVWQRQ